jgi:hypothetical protein
VPRRTHWQVTSKPIRKVLERCLSYLGDAMRLEAREELNLPYLHPRLSRVRILSCPEVLQRRAQAMHPRHRHFHSLGSTLESKRICVVVGGRAPEGGKK